MSSLIVISQTYKEPELVRKFLAAWASFEGDVKLIIANSAPGTETSFLLGAKTNVSEVKCTEADFWAGATRRALEYCEGHFPYAEKIIICNIDVTPNSFDWLMVDLSNIPKSSAFSYTVYADNEKFYSGVKRRRVGLIPAEKITPSIGESIPVDYAPTRFLLVNNSSLLTLSEFIPRNLPHYGADFVFTSAMSVAGVSIEAKGTQGLAYDAENTGIKYELRGVPLRKIFGDIKSVHNLKFRYRTYRGLGHSKVTIVLYLAPFILFVVIQSLLSQLFA